MGVAVVGNCLFLHVIFVCLLLICVYNCDDGSIARGQVCLLHTDQTVMSSQVKLSVTCQVCKHTDLIISIEVELNLNKDVDTLAQLSPVRLNQVLTKSDAVKADPQLHST
jgi:hypothetical protein